MKFIWNIGTKIHYQGPQLKGIIHFLAVLQRDMEKVLREGVKSANTTILIEFQESGQLEVEQFSLLVSEKEIKLTAGDELGVIYGILYLSKQYLGVDPFWFWSDRAPEHKEQVSISKCNYQSMPAITRFRGWFINDEVLIAHWQMNGSNKNVWEMAFEALLRCGGNMVIAGTDIDNPVHKDMAADMGIWITHHHAEPLGARMFSRVHPKKKPSYSENKELFHQLWREAVEEQRDKKVIWNVGFRGQGDYPFWFNDPSFDTDEKRGKLINQIIKDQLDIISAHQQNPVCCVNLYGEITELYKSGCLDLPMNVIKIWADSGYGKMVSRRQDNHNPRVSALAGDDDIGPHGIYYHVTFYDLQASNHLTMLPNSPEFVHKELTEAFAHQMNEFLIVNCGNIRPHLYYLDLVSKVWQVGNLDINIFNNTYFQQYFPMNADFMKEMYQEFQQCIIQYGKHTDERAGEQFYYYSIRYLAHAWIAHKQQADGLYWLTGEKPLAEQFTWIHKIVDKHLKNWKNLYLKAHNRLTNTQKRTEEEKRIWDQFYIQVLLHYKGAKALKLFTDAYKEYTASNHTHAFMKIGLAETELEAVVEALNFATAEKWSGFYANDCLTNVSLVKEIVQTVKKFVRMIDDGPHFYQWEREQLMTDKEKSVVLLTNKTKQLSDEELLAHLVRKEME